MAEVIPGLSIDDAPACLVDAKPDISWAISPLLT